MKRLIMTIAFIWLLLAIPVDAEPQSVIMDEASTYRRTIPANMTLIYAANPRFPYQTDWYDNATLFDWNFSIESNVSLAVDIYNMTYTFCEITNHSGVGYPVLEYLISDTVLTNATHEFDFSPWEGYVSHGRGWVTLWWPMPVLFIHNNGNETAFIEMQNHRSYEVVGFEEPLDEPTRIEDPDPTSSQSKDWLLSDRLAVAIGLIAIVVIGLLVGYHIGRGGDTSEH